ncbi:MAG: 15,16-dihydrobiliverdin:ferredoxin oxidoreductase [Synechococcales cyanobacterium RM1_1_8]|nr:15,16-dihydrobiliverdin:ferredoxin oxidoreductase [Synechococcales cyanobacterium RM1_1_8]
MYKPFQKYLEQALFETFELTPSPIPLGLDRNVSERGRSPATIQSWCYRSPEMRKIRYTYIDAGEAAQVFNGVLYPNPCYDAPVLGIDFLSFGKKKILVVMDFQPLFRDEAYLAKYIEPMGEMYDRYGDLAQNLGMKFYDANQYFSKYLLFAKTDEATVASRVFPAFQDYVQSYIQLIKQAEPNHSPASVERIVAAQKAYDQYSAERDPAHGLFTSYFGAEWADRFLYEFLFEDAVQLAASH